MKPCNEVLYLLVGVGRRVSERDFFLSLQTIQVHRTSYMKDCCQAFGILAVLFVSYQEALQNVSKSSKNLTSHCDAMIYADSPSKTLCSLMIPVLIGFVVLRKRDLQSISRTPHSLQAYKDLVRNSTNFFVGWKARSRGLQKLFCGHTVPEGSWKIIWKPLSSFED